MRDDIDYDPKKGFTTPTAVEVSFTSPRQSLGTTSSTSSTSIEYQSTLSKINLCHPPCINTNLECDDDMLFKRTHRRLSTAPILPDIPSPSDQNDGNYNGVSVSDPLRSPQSNIFIASQHLQPPNHNNSPSNNSMQLSSIVYIDHDFNSFSPNVRRKLFLSVDLDDEAVSTSSSTLTSQNYSSPSPSVNILRRRSMTYPFL